MSRGECRLVGTSSPPSPWSRSVDQEWDKEKQRKEGKVSKVRECKVEDRSIFGRYLGLIVFNFK